jgi:hypothetical protein
MTSPLLALALCFALSPAPVRAGGALDPSALALRAGDEHLDAWPKLPDADRTKKDIDRLRRASTPKMGEEALAALTADGAGVVPLLLPIYEKDRDEAVLGRVREVLDAVTGPPHTRLLAKEFAHRSGRVRVWALARAAACADKEVAPAAEEALTKARALGEKADPEELYLAALCATASGSLAGFDIVRKRALERWNDSAKELRTALASVRGADASQRIAPALGQASRDEQLAGLRMLAGCGDPSSTSAVRPFLDSADNLLRIEAINALRGIVDGELPLDKLPVFEAIELADKWKMRLGGHK